MTWQKRSAAVSLILLMATYLFPIRANAQDNSSQQDDKASQQTLEPPKVDLPRDRTGVDPNKRLDLSLRDAISMALEHNLDIAIEKDNIKIAEFNLLSALGVYDVLTSADFNFRRDNRPTGSSLEGGLNSSSQLTDSYSYNFGASKLLNTGGSLEVDFNNRRSKTNFAFATLNPQFNTQLTVTFRQPLMKNYSIDQNRRNIRSLKKQLDLSDLNFRQKLIDLIARVQGAYYDLAFSIRNEEIQREAVNLAAVQLRNNQIQVKAGTAAPIEIVSAEAELERRKDAAIAALLAITQAENSLKNLVLDDPASDMWNSQIITEPVEFTPEPIDLTSAINIAMDRRPEVKQLDLQSELNKIDLEFFKNQEKPQIDLIALFGGAGLGGQVKSSTPPPGGSAPASNPFSGGYGTSLGNLFDFRTYQIGVSFTFPLRNRTAKANLSRALVSGNQIDSRKKQMVQSIISEVRNAVQAVETARQRVDAAQAAVRAAEAQLKGEEQKFAVGLSTNFFVLERQNDLSSAKGNLLRAQTDYNKARADLQRVMANNVP